MTGIKEKEMKTGIELIAQERKEQIEKHGRTVESDVAMNEDNQLGYAAVLLLKKDHFSTSRMMFPYGWEPTLWLKMYSKTRKERLIIAGALIAAEIDRIQAIEPAPSGDKSDEG